MFELISAKILISLTKARLALSVVFSSIAGYFLAVDVVDFNELILLVVGGYSIVGASNSFNQIIEKDKDILMDRTKNRPLPAKEITTQTAFFAAISVFLYTCVYTPLKPITPLSVFIGAIPGAIPFMLGWVAATGSFGIEPGTLFMIQFFWQFPHFWALGWMLDDDYKKAGFVMLPTGNRDKSTALQIILYIIWMMIISVFPYTGLTGDLTLSFGSTIAILLLGIIMLVLAINLYNKMDISSARKLFYSSVLYLTLIQIIYLIDKFL